MLRIGVFLHSSRESGGGFQYELTVAKLLQKRCADQYRVFFFVSDTKYATHLESLGLQTITYHDSYVSKIHRIASRNVWVYRFLKYLNMHLNNIDRLLDGYGIDLVYFLSPNSKCADLSHHSYILTVWDLCHRDFMEFPEVSAFKDFESREEFYNRHLTKAIAVTVDSPLGKERLARRYGVDRERINVLPFLPSESIQHDSSAIDVKRKYGIDGEYLFYPAQFWAHKNHIYILDALRLLRDQHSVRVHALFSGSDKGNLGYVLKKVTEYGLGDQVRYIGFVEAEEIPCLYKQALALVMPTYFGPTNLPPIEAFALGCPVCYSDLEGLREQVADAAFLMDLSNPRTLVAHLLTLQTQPELVAEKKEKGRKLVTQWTEDDFWRELESILNSFSIKRRCWGPSDQA